MRREPSYVKVKDVLDDRLLFGACELSAVRWSFCAWQDSGASIEGMAFDVEGGSSSAMALELASIISFKG